MQTPCVDILLATYQGENYVEEQIDSIFSQTHASFHLWIRDDGSSDQTVSLLQQIAHTYPQKVTLLSSQRNLGITQNFSELLKASQAPYVCFADQDDKWFSNKLALSLEQMKELESLHGASTPLLVHTDLTVTKKDLSVIHPSFWRYTRLNPYQTGLNRLLAQNCLTGCTMMMNRPLANLAQPIPVQALMHDWWVGLVAACFGRIGVIGQPTILYRQHELNDTGAKGYGIRKFLTQSAKETKKKAESAKGACQQAQLLLERYQPLLNPETSRLLKSYASLRQLSYLKQKRQIFKHKFFKQGLLRNLKALLNKI